MWYNQWFQDENYLIVYAHRDGEEARRTIDLFERIVTPPARASLLDLCCGNGRHALELSRRGYRVTGIDLSDTLLDRGRRDAEKQNLEIRFFQEDMRQLKEEEEFDAVLNLFTSFGYFTEDSENAAVIASVTRTLVTGGWFMLDFLNADFVKSHLQPRDEREQDGQSIIQERIISDGRINKTITIHSGSSTRQYYESVRLYTRKELIGMFERNELTVVHEAGDYDDTPFMPASPRCILFGRKE